MNNGFIDLCDIATLDGFLALSNHAPVVIFKHSETCGISDRAYREMQKLAEPRTTNSNEKPIAGIPIGIVGVQAARDVSNEVEARTGVAHESPQVFVLLAGQLVWSASHGGVRAEAVEQAVRDAVSSGQ
jgi:bacillithiol system protein YtxJ